jgi:hemolysin III
MDAAPSTELETVPLLRGVLHAVFCPVALVAGGVLAWLAPSPRAALALLVMSSGFAAIFGTSGLYHRVKWSPIARRRLRQADHSMIFVGMATTYTAIWLIALDGWISDAVLVYCWVAAFAGVLAKVWWLDAHPTRHWLGYVGFGLVGIVVVPTMWQTMGSTGVGLMIAGAVAFAAGGAAYAAGWPNLHARWFGHHELFHAGTIIGSALYIGALAHFALS